MSTSSPSEKISSFLLRVPALLAPPGDDLLAAFDRRGAVGTEAGPVGDPVRRVAQEGGGAEGVGQHDQQVAAIVALPVLQHLVGRLLQLLVAELASAASTIGSSCALVPSASRSLSMASSTLEVPVKASPMPSFSASTHQRCHRKRMAPARAEVGNADVRAAPSAARSWPTSWPWRGHRAHRARTGPKALIAARERSSLMMASAGISHSVVYIHGPAKVELVLAVALGQLVFGQPEILQPGEEFRLEDLLAAIEIVAGQPDHLLLGEAQRAGMIELLAQFAARRSRRPAAPTWCG